MDEDVTENVFYHHKERSRKSYKRSWRMNFHYLETQQMLVNSKNQLLWQNWMKNQLLWLKVEQYLALH